MFRIIGYLLKIFRMYFKMFFKQSKLTINGYQTQRLSIELYIKQKKIIRKYKKRKKIFQKENQFYSKIHFKINQ